MAGQKFVQIAVSIINVPLIISHVGTESYGLFLAISGFAQWFLFDNGISESIKLRLIKEFERGRTQQIVQLTSTGMFVLTLLSLVVLLGFIFASNYVPWQTLFPNGMLLGPDLQLTVVLVSCLMIVSIPMRFLREIYTAEQKGYLYSSIMTACSLTSLGAVLVVVDAGYGLTALITAVYGSQVIVLFVCFFFYLVKRSDCRPKLNSVKVVLIGRLVKNSALLFLFGISRMVIHGADIFLVNLILGGTEAANYALVTRLYLYLEMTVSFIAYPSWPLLSSAIVANHTQWALKILKRIIVVTTLISAIGCLVASFAVPTVIYYWTNGAIETVDRALIVCVGVYMSVRMISAAFGLFLRAFNAVKVQVIVIFIEACIFVSVGVWGLHSYGLIGFAMAATLSILCTRGVILPALCFSKIKQLDERN